MSDSSKVNIEGVSGEMNAGDIAGRDVVKKTSAVSKAVDAMADQYTEQSKTAREMTAYFAKMAMESQKEVALANKLCSQRLNEQAERYEKQLDKNAEADRKRSEWFEEKLSKYDKAIGRIVKEKEHAYQAMKDSQGIIDAQRGTIQEQQEIIDMQQKDIDELKDENKTQAKQIDDLNSRVAHLENGGARNFHHPE